MITVLTFTPPLNAETLNNVADARSIHTGHFYNTRHFFTHLQKPTLFDFSFRLLKIYGLFCVDTHLYNQIGSDQYQFVWNVCSAWGVIVSRRKEKYCSFGIMYCLDALYAKDY